MLAQKFKDLKKRKLYFKLEYAKKISKVIVVSLLNVIGLKKKQAYLHIKLLKLQHKIQHFSKVQIKNRCVLSNRGKAVSRSFGVSRIKMRELIHLGVLPGYKKAVW